MRRQTGERRARGMPAIKTRTWAVGLAALFVLAAAGAAWVYLRAPAGKVANIYQDGVCIHSVDLNAVKEAYQLPITSARGTNTILVEPGRICMLSADCDDQICVHAGWLSDRAAPIVCLPHRIVIELDGAPAQAGSVSGADAVSQ